MAAMIDPNAQQINRDKPMSATEVAFFAADGSHQDVPCVHASQVTAAAQEYDQFGTLGIIAMNYKGFGLFATYMPDELRAMAKQLERMANYIDEQNNG